jgi:hypothetical protein
MLVSPIGIKVPPKDSELSGFEEYIRINGVISEGLGKEFQSWYDKVFTKIFWSEGNSMFSALRVMGDATA